MGRSAERLETTSEKLFQSIVSPRSRSVTSNPCASSKQDEEEEKEEERMQTDVSQGRGYVFCTVDGQGGRIAGRPCRVRGGTRVFPGVGAVHSLDGHQTDTFPGARYRDIGAIVGGDRLAVQGPGQLDGQVPLHDGAHSRDRFSPIRGFVTDRERRDLRRHWKKLSFVRSSGYVSLVCGTPREDRMIAK